MHELFEYGLRISPALALVAITFIITPRNLLVMRIMLLIFGLTALLTTLIVLITNQDLAKLVKWGSYKEIRTYITGLLGAAIIAVPLLMAYQFVPIGLRGGEFADTLLPALLIMALLGNFMEEVLFRGFLQGHLEKLYGVGRALLLSALMFAVGHIFLSSTVTSVGLPVLLFTLYEGLVLGHVRNKGGVTASTISHGLAIFVLASALI